MSTPPKVTTRYVETEVMKLIQKSHPNLFAAYETSKTKERLWEAETELWMETPLYIYNQFLAEQGLPPMVDPYDKKVPTSVASIPRKTSLFHSKG